MSLNTIRNAMMKHAALHKQSDAWDRRANYLENFVNPPPPISGYTVPNRSGVYGNKPYEAAYNITQHNQQASFGNATAEAARNDTLSAGWGRKTDKGTIAPNSTVGSNIAKGQADAQRDYFDYDYAQRRSTLGRPELHKPVQFQWGKPSTWFGGMGHYYWQQVKPSLPKTRGEAVSKAMNPTTYISPAIKSPFYLYKAWRTKNVEEDKARQASQKEWFAKTKAARSASEQAAKDFVAGTSLPKPLQGLNTLNTPLPTPAQNTPNTGAVPGSPWIQQDAAAQFHANQLQQAGDMLDSIGIGPGERIYAQAMSAFNRAAAANRAANDPNAGFMSVVMANPELIQTLTDRIVQNYPGITPQQANFILRDKFFKQIL